MQIYPKIMRLHLKIYEKSVENTKNSVKIDILSVIVCELMIFLIILLRI